MDVIIILGCLFLLMYLAYKGYSTIVVAPACGLLCIALIGKAVLPAYSELFMIKTSAYIKNFLPLFLLGAVFGQLMSDSGFVRSIAKAVIEKLGKKRALLAVALAGNVLSYGGISVFVIIFALYPFAAAIYKEADIPKRFICGAILLGAFTPTLGCFPGTPQIQNVIPAAFYGTSLFAGPGIGITTGIILWIVVYLYMTRQHKKAAAAGEGYGENHKNEPVIQETGNDINWLLAATPLVAVIAINFFITYFITWAPELLEPYKAMKLPLVAGAIKNVQSSWALVIALTAGSLLIVLVGKNHFANGFAGVVKSINAGANGAVIAIMNTACLVGFASLLASADAFKTIIDALMGIRLGETPLWSVAISVNLLSAITGSASGAVSMALDLMGNQWLEWALRSGVSADTLTRIMVISSVGTSLTPHNGSVVTLLTVCGLTHKQSYGNIFVITLFKGAASVVAIFMFYLFGNF